MTHPVTVLACRLAGEDPFTSDRFDVRAPVLRDEFDYWRAMNDLWGSDRTIVNVEHDMEFSDELVAGLVDCPHPLCTYPYRCYLAARKIYVYPPSVDGAFVAEGTEWADWSSLGFVKIRPEARKAPLRRSIWKFLEHSMNAGTSGFEFSPGVPEHRPPVELPRVWHVHWPEIRHFHDYDSEAWERASDWERFCEENGQPCLVWPSRVTEVRSFRLDELRGEREADAHAS